MRTPRKPRLGISVVLSVAVLASAGPCLAQTPGGDETTKGAVRALADSECARCHGPEGRSTDPAVPHLAGQQRAFLEVQIKAFRAQKRRGPEAHYMRTVAATWLEDEKVQAEIAEYFSSRPPVPGRSGDPAIIALGRQLYEKPNPERSFPNCAGCHGARAEGLSVFPRLASQQAQYLTRQIRILRVGRRDASTTHAALKGFSEAELAALAAYLQSE